MNEESETELSDPKGISKNPESRNRAKQGEESENQEYRIRGLQEADFQKNCWFL